MPVLFFTKIFQERNDNMHSLLAIMINKGCFLFVQAIVSVAPPTENIFLLHCVYILFNKAFFISIIIMKVVHISTINHCARAIFGVIYSGRQKLKLLLKLLNVRQAYQSHVAHAIARVSNGTTLLN